MQNILETNEGKTLIEIKIYFTFKTQCEIKPYFNFYPYKSLLKTSDNLNKMKSVM